MDSKGREGRERRSDGQLHINMSTMSKDGRHAFIQSKGERETERRKNEAEETRLGNEIRPVEEGRWPIRGR